MFNNVYMTINPAEFVVILGKSGSGKSTLLNLISGIDLPSQGDVIIDSTCINRLSEHERTLFRRHHIGFVFQFFNLIPTLTVEENLLLPLELKGGVTNKERTGAVELLDQVGLSGRLKSYPDRLSGGQQQRVALARALAHDPILVLADEPTGNLDHETSIQVVNLLNNLSQQAGKTLIMATHSADVMTLADRIFTIESGNMVETQVKDQA